LLWSAPKNGEKDEKKKRKKRKGVSILPSQLRFGSKNLSMLCSHLLHTRGNKYRLYQGHVKYDLRKYCFTNRVTGLWNSLPDIVVRAETVNSFKTRLDKHWQRQEIRFNWKSSINGTGSRSIIDESM
jgi:hypothetical protein